MELLNDPQFKTIYEDVYTFVLDGITFTIKCRIDSFGTHYYPDAHNQQGERATGRMLPWRNPFEGLNFASPPNWLINAISSEYSMYTEPQKKTRRDPAQPGEFYIPLWELPHIQGPLKYWAREHPFIGCEKEILNSWKNARGLIEVVKYQRHEHQYLEIMAWNTQTKQYGEPERIPGYQRTLEVLGERLAQVAGSRPRAIKKPKPKREKKVIQFPSGF